MFSFEFSFYIWVLLGVALCAIAFICTAGLRKTRLVGNYIPPEYEESDAQAAEELNNEVWVDIDAETGGARELAKPELPSVGVVVYAFTDVENLDTYIEQLMAQTYPNYRVVIVYDGGAEITAALSDKYAPLYSNLHITFIPPGSRNLSRRKLAYMLGIKAAETDYVITTASNCLIPSNRWIEEMVQPFIADKEKDVALGYAHIDFDELHGWGRWYRQFDTVVTSIIWVGAAIANKPYRGTRFNLAFRRQLFFDAKGYASSISYESGDDDIFVNEITNSRNTQMLLTDETILTTTWGDSARRIWTDQKERYSFNAMRLPRKPFVFEGVCSGMRWLALAASAAAALLGWPSLIPLCGAVALLLIWWGFEIAAYRKAAEKLQAVRLWWAVPIFRLLRPVANFIFMLKHLRDRNKNFTYLCS